jgi:hypothetical protein
MTKPLRLQSIGLLVGAGLLALAGCSPGETTPDAGVDDSICVARGQTAAEECRRNFDCGGGSVCDKANETDETGCCKKVLCTSDADCGASEICDLRRGICISEDTCDPSDPDACPDGQFCFYENGTPLCSATPPGALACTVAPNPVIARAGESVELRAIGQDAAGKLTPFAAFTYTSTVGTVSGGALTGECASGVCTGTVTATSTRGSATCEASVRVFATVPATDVRVVLIDQATGAPIAGARVAARDAVADAFVEGTTDANGAYIFEGLAAANAASVSAYPAGHQWQTVVRPTANDVALYTMPISDATKVAGVKGRFNFDNTTTSGDIRLGLAGMAIGSAITDLDFATLLGEISDYNVVLEGVTDPGGEEVPLPSGLVLELAGEPVKGDFVVFGQEGPSVLWALGGKVRLSDIGSIITSVTASSDDVNVGQILSAVLPFFSKFDHAIVSGLDLSEVNRPAGSGGDIPVPYADWNFPDLTGANRVNLNTLLSQSAEYTVPRLPCVAGQGTTPNCANNEFTSGAVLLSGAIVPGIGLVPLGLTAGLDVPDAAAGNALRDGQLDYIQPTDGTQVPAKGKAILDYAPPHDGLEGSLFVTIAIALDIDGLTDGAIGASTITHVTPKYGATNTFPTDFLEHQGGTWDFEHANGRTFTLNRVGSADFYRLNLSKDDNEWNIWFNDSDAVLSVVDLRPADLVDQRETAADVQAFKFGTGYAGKTPASFTELIAFNGTNFDNLLYYMGGWSSEACLDAAEGTTPHCLRNRP